MHARRSKSQDKDEIFDLVEMLQIHRAQTVDGFLQDVVLNPSPCAILNDSWRTWSHFAVVLITLLSLE